MTKYQLQFIIPVIVMIAAIIEAWRDAKLNNPEHNFSALIRGAFVMGVCIWLFWKTSLFWYWSITYWFVNMGFFWILFDLAYNRFKGNDWFYIGETSSIDKLARKYIGAGNTYLGVKILLTILAVCAYVLFD
jgi:hypothetical protein